MATRKASKPALRRTRRPTTALTAPIAPEQLRDLERRVAARIESIPSEKQFDARRFLTALIRDTLGVDSLRAIRAIDARAALQIADEARLPQALAYDYPMPTDSLSRALRMRELDLADSVSFDQVRDAVHILANYTEGEGHPDARQLTRVLRKTQRMLDRLHTIATEASRAGRHIIENAESLRAILDPDYMTIHPTQY